MMNNRLKTIADFKISLDGAPRGIGAPLSNKTTFMLN